MKRTIIPETPKFHDCLHEAENCPYSERHFSSSILYIPVTFRLIVMLSYFLRLNFPSLVFPSASLTKLLCPCPTAPCSPYILFFTKFSSLHHFVNDTTYYISHYLFFSFFLYFSSLYLVAPYSVLFPSHKRTSILSGKGLGWRKWLRCRATSRTVPGLIPVVSLDFSVTYFFRPYHGPGVDWAPSENEYQKLFLGVKADGALGWRPHHLHVLNVMKSGTLNLLEHPGPHRTPYGTPLPLYCLVMHYKFVYQYSSSFNTRHCLILKNLNCTMTTAIGWNICPLLCHNWFLVAEERLQSLGSSCGIYGSYISTGTASPWLLRF